MTQLRERERVEVTVTPDIDHTLDGTLSVLGVIAGLVGLYLYVVPADWFLGGLVEGWYLGMFMAAGLLLGLALAIYAREVYLAGTTWTSGVITATVLSVIGFAAAVTFLLIWIL